MNLTRSGLDWRGLLLLVCVGGGNVLVPHALYAQNSSTEPLKWPELGTDAVVSRLTRPVDIQSADDGSGRLFIVEQLGRIRFLEAGELKPFLDIRDRVQDSGNEQGLLGLAFPPGFPDRAYFYVNYTAREGGGDTRISRFRLSTDSGDGDPNSEEVLLTIDQPYGNHNAGQLQFGPDGFLYVGTGDGGSGQDPEERAQNPRQLLGKMLRLDVESTVGTAERYRIPADNPFVADDGVRDEIWALGLRNPWRYSFDRRTGDLFIADVGQNAWEEVNFQPADSPGGENYGWDFYEGNHRQTGFNSDSPPPQEDLTFPIFEYSHSLGASVTGGYVYRGAEYPRMEGIYLFGDFGSGRIWGSQRDTDGQWVTQMLLDSPLSISTFGEDESGELFVAELSGRIYQLTDSQDRHFGRFKEVELSQSGEFRFTYGVDSRRPYRVEVSPDLETWSVWDLFEPGSREIEVVVAETAEQDARFFRVVEAGN